MELTILLILALAAFLCTVASAAGKCPLWVATVLICVYLLVEQLPIGDS